MVQGCVGVAFKSCADCCERYKAASIVHSSSLVWIALSGSRLRLLQAVVWRKVAAVVREADVLRG